MLKETLVSMNSVHLTDETIDILEDCDIYEFNLSIYPYKYGWFIYVGDDEYYEDEMPEDLLTLVKRAREAGADWLQLDCDVPFEDDLPTYNGC